MLLVHADRLAASRAACTAGSKSPTSVPMMAITTKSSTSVKPRRAAVANEFVRKPIFMSHPEGMSRCDGRAVET